MLPLLKTVDDLVIGTKIKSNERELVDELRGGVLRDRLTGFDQSLMRLGDRELALLGVLICGVKVQTSVRRQSCVVVKKKGRESSKSVEGWERKIGFR